ncbi:putative RING-H2 finger protein ATL21A [Hibiscus syriacus]|uniref:putative RING-H2 finger protein ATL21A n=1 Tax=Hibiscus syriacus TaxID=106335 RepID=UPI001923A2F7|nr:putative RING-H2 finger protein ATL21A [Hibiscus syriacus]
MDTLILFSFLFLLLCATAAEPCSIAMCGKNKVPIRFPFRQQGKQSRNCRYPGFDLGCGSQNTVYLKLPYSGEFYVRDIKYLDQQISLYDPSGCLPKRLLSLNLSASPFVAVFIQNYTFLNCPTQITTSRFNAIDCLSNSTSSILATSSARLANKMASSSCRIITVLLIPVSWRTKDDEELTAALDADIQLTWNAPQCGNCEEQGGIRELKSNSSEEIDCFHTPRRKGRGLQVFRVISLCIALPALSGAIGITVFAYFQDRFNPSRRNPYPMQLNNGTAEVLPQPVLVVTGLDESTIESYEKIVLGESWRIPGPNDSTSPICLSEYLSQDIIRCIPKCKHSFHAECIDEWLRMNSMCPVCQKSPAAEDASSRNDPV